MIDLPDFIRAVANQIEARIDNKEEVVRLVTLLRDTMNEKLEEWAKT